MQRRNAGYAGHPRREGGVHRTLEKVRMHQINVIDANASHERTQQRTVK
ncbi:MAG: hypothetical protein P3C09_12455 [Gemmatimonadota bacterium]|nr:hypothetical protein [Gemmatimonadota bacterium]